jgi:hypothetical protein
MNEREPFDPADPFNIACEHFRKQTVDLLMKAERIAVYRDLDVGLQLNAFMAGVLTGLIGVCFASIREDGRDALMEALSRDLMPQARAQAEDIMNNALPG